MELKNLTDLIVGFQNGPMIGNALNMLLPQLEVGGVVGTSTTLVMIIEGPDGGLAIVLKDGELVEKPIQMGMLASEAAHKTQKYAAALAAARIPKTS